MGISLKVSEILSQEIWSKLTFWVVSQRNWAARKRRPDKKGDTIDTSRRRRLSRQTSIVIGLLFAVQVASAGSAGADGTSPQPGRDCENTAYNLFEIDENGDIDEAALYADDMNEPNFSSPPGKIVIDLSGPGKVSSNPPVFHYNYENNTQDWLIWKIKIDGDETVTENLSPKDQIIHFPQQQGMLEFVGPQGTGLEPPDFVLFCLVKAGSLTIRKDVTPNNAQDFSFTLSSTMPLNTKPQGPLGSGLGAFALDDDPSNVGLRDSVHFVLPVQDTDENGNLFAPGPYLVIEGPVAGFGLSTITCSGESDDGSGVALDGGHLIVDLDFGENITCTFANVTAGAAVPTKSLKGKGSSLASTGLDLGNTRTAGLGLLVAAGLLALTLSLRGLVRTQNS